MRPIYDPVEFIRKIEFLTITLIGSFITMKLFNSIYENLYDPFIDTYVNSNNAKNYYLPMGKYYIQIGNVINEFIKWFFVFSMLMLLYNCWLYKFYN